jgi:hypothetical protein
MTPAANGKSGTHSNSKSNYFVGAFKKTVIGMSFEFIIAVCVGQRFLGATVLQYSVIP